MRPHWVKDGMRGLAALALVAWAGCSGQAPGADGDPSRWPVGDDAGTCTAVDPQPGCPCEPGSAPVTCFADPETVSDGLFCREGRMHCRDGVWSACETVRTFTLERSLGSLITDPAVCNPCNPDCFETTDEPDETELTPDNSVNVSYDPGGGGVIIEADPVMPDLPDTDGDGIPDLGEEVVADGGLFHVLPFGGPSEIDPLDIPVQVTTADVYFLIDDSGSMDGEIDNLRNDLTSGTFNGCSGGLIGAIQCTIPNTWIGVGSFEEYAEWPYGVDGNEPYQHHQDITDDASAAQAAVNGLTTGGNQSWPESDTQALWALATGNGLTGYVPARTGCPADHWGYGCFRPETIPIVVLFTDAPFHNGPNPDHDYEIQYFETGEYDLPASFTSVSLADDFSGSIPNLGNVAGRWIGIEGDTSTLENDWSGYGCGAGTSPDGAIFFEMDRSGTVLFSSEGTSFDSVFSVWDLENNWLYCDDDDPGLGTAATREVWLPAGRHLLILDGDGAGESGPFQMSLGTVRPPKWSDAVQALNSRGFKTIVIESSEGRADALENSVALANATGSIDDSGSPYVFSIAADGTGLSGSVVDAVDRLANSTRFDVSLQARDPADGPDEDNGVDETGFVQSITPVGWGPGDCQGTSANGFTQCSPGTNLDFEVEFQNDFVEPMTTEQVFDFEMEVLLDGSVQDTIPVRIVVPAEVPTYPAPGEYHRDFDASLVCEIPPDRPDWNILSYEVSTPSDTSVDFEIRAAPTEDGLPSATPATFRVPADGPDTGSFDVGQLLLDAELPINEPFLRVTAVLNPSSNQLDTPVLHGFDFQFNCVAGE